MTTSDTHSARLSAVLDQEEAAAAATPWYRRKGFLVAAAAAAIVAVTVITDLPAPASRASDVAAAKSFVSEVNSDIVGCGYSLKEAVTIYEGRAKGVLTPADRARVPKLLTDDQMACSATSQAFFDLSNVEVPTSTSGKQLAQIVGIVEFWTTRDALGQIEAIQTLWNDPTNAAALGDLQRYALLGATDRAAANGSLVRTESLLQANLHQLDLPAIPASGGLPLTP